MKLKRLLKNIPVSAVKGSKEIEITGISSHSKLVFPGNLFIAKRGERSHGTRFIEEAIHGGAQAILTDVYDPTLKVVQIIHPAPALIEGKIAKEYYQNPSSKLFTVGITGTNGKTTTSYLTKFLLDEKSEPCGLIGTIEYLIGNYRYQASHTTPDVLANHKMLKELVLQKADSVVMEVTSHGIEQGRISQIDFDVVVFTNLSQDHLDYHQTMENYAQAKKKLFDQVKKEGIAIVNQDSPWSSTMTQDCRAATFTYGIEKEADFQAKNIQFSDQGSCFELVFKNKSYLITLPMVGRFNIYNALAAIAIAHSKGVSIEIIQKKLQIAPQVPGRLQKVENSLGLNVYIDFAHTEDALASVLTSLSELKTDRLLTLFGCGGDRDMEKRPKMALVCENYSDFVVVTSDNPRSEDPEKICRDIIQGFKADNYQVIIDRKEAIRAILERAEKGDIVLIAGKGHEKTQIIGRQTLDFDDYAIVQQLLSELACV